HGIPVTGVTVEPVANGEVTGALGARHSPVKDKGRREKAAEVLGARPAAQLAKRNTEAPAIDRRGNRSVLGALDVQTHALGARRGGGRVAPRSRLEADGVLGSALPGAEGVLLLAARRRRDDLVPAEARLDAQQAATLHFNLDLPVDVDVFFSPSDLQADSDRLGRLSLWRRYSVPPVNHAIVSQHFDGVERRPALNRHLKVSLRRGRQHGAERRAVEREREGDAVSRQRDGAAGRNRLPDSVARELAGP